MTPRPGRTMVVGMEMCSYGERLLRLNLFSFQGRLLRNDIIMIWKIIKGLCSIPAAKLFSFYSTGNITIGHQYKMFLPHGNSEISSHFLSVHVISRWNFLSADTIPAENLDRLKARLHRDLGDEFFSYYHWYVKSFFIQFLCSQMIIWSNFYSCCLNCLEGHQSSHMLNIFLSHCLARCSKLLDGLWLFFCYLFTRLATHYGVSVWLSSTLPSNSSIRPFHLLCIVWLFY